LFLVELIDLFSRYKFRFSTEAELQLAIEKVLTVAGLKFTKEAVLSSKDRVDFLLDSGIGIEVKIGGSAMQLARQVRRYCESEKITGLLVVVTKSKLLDLPKELNSKPIESYYVR